MASLTHRKYEPTCILAHHLINKLTVIIGGCDLLREMDPRSRECAQRILLIRETAQAMADELREHQNHLDAMVLDEPEMKCDTALQR